ncbi:Kinesin associated protein KAP [Klebsormidium nitens]|uniref:Kinesin associated protein KAP n=1 Tax=Klebsormidium nitens TaxID=105231 RepID=A0A1Y1IM27_KLENI|nr:Kinesin associated protein KAP [Klebsormidium nitens]|eukprot:GAQ89168.1 Kinesin associated protein KAP [Klebsormidium nitens]
MEQPGPEYVKKKVRILGIELAEDEGAIVVLYEVEGTFYADDGVTLETTLEPKEKRIKLKRLTESSDIPRLAKDVVEKCKLLSQSKVPVVESLLYELQRRELEADYRHQSKHDAHDMRRLDVDRLQEEALSPESRPGSAARLEDLEDYLEQLYEGLDEKVRATGLILQLARQTENLEGLLTHTTLLGALARVLREDGRKSLDLSLNIVGVYFAFSNFSQFHQVLVEQQIGTLTMGIIDLEVQRIDAKAAEGAVSPGDRPASRASRRQEKLLYLCFYLLLHLAEDVSIEKKMKKRNITSYLVKMLERRSVDLLILAVVFLKKLSIFRENKDDMREAGIADKLAALVPCKNEGLLGCVLRLLLNLSFDSELRDDMAKSGLIPKLVGLLKSQRHVNLVLGLLYHVSVSDASKSMFTYTEAIPIVQQMLLQSTDTRASPELIALAINLTVSPRNAEVMCDQGGFDQLLSRALRGRDALLFKVVRNFSHHEALKPRFHRYVPDLVHVATEPDTSTELLVEVLGTVGNLTCAGLGLDELAADYGLLPALADLLHPGHVEDDVMLEAIVLVGTLCSAGTESGIISAGIVGQLWHVLQEKQEDLEMVAQTVYVFQRLLLLPAARAALLALPNLVPGLVHILQSRSPVVRAVADQVLDSISGLGPQWEAAIRRLKFEAHNREWMDAVQDDSEDEGSPYSAGGGGPPGPRGYSDDEEDHSPGSDIDMGWRLGKRGSSRGRSPSDDGRRREDIYGGPDMEGDYSDADGEHEQMRGYRD